jgi:hypothetical protein
MNIVENSLTVLQLAELVLERASLAWSAKQASEWMRQRGFDAAPLDEPELYRFVGASWLEPNDDPVAGQARLVVLRDNLAHGNGLLGAEPEPVRAIDLFEAVRSFAEKMWELT